MRKINIIWIFVLISVSSINVYSYIDCTPPACSSGYVANGTTCSGSTCDTQCITYECNMQWNQVFSDTTTFGWPTSTAAQDFDNSASYNPTNTSQCYKFKYVGPTTSTSDIAMDVDDPPSGGYGDCDTEGIGGFFEGTGSGSGTSTPWFNGMGSYIGFQNDQDVDYLLEVVRGHTEADDTTAYRISMSDQGSIIVDGSIYCVPTNSISCKDLGGTSTCDNDCYNKDTEAYATQGYFQDKGTQNKTLYQDVECLGNVNVNRYNPAKFYVYSSTPFLSNVTSSTSCNRINEPPNVTNVLVIPTSPNAGQDLECTFNYTDPENFVEQNSTYEWWKNSVNQNINSKILNKGNLTVGDNWYCKVTPSDGLLFGTQVQSNNTVTVLTTVKDPIFKIGGSLIWNKASYYGNKEEILGFNQQINDAIALCVPDQNGICDINFIFTSNATGVIELTNLEIYYNDSAPTNNPPNITVPNITPIQPTINDSINCSTTPTDNQQTNLNVSFTWYKNGISQPQFDTTVGTTSGTLTYTNTNVTNLKKGESWICSARAFDGSLYSNWINSSSVIIQGPTTLDHFIVGYGGNKATSANYEIIYSLLPQPIGKFVSTNYNMTLGFSFYGE